MKKAFYILVIFAISLITGCKVTGDYFIGNGFCNTHLTLRGDSSFVYQTFSDVGGIDTITGRWSKNKGIIILNSNQRPKFKPNALYEKVVSGQLKKLIIIQLMDESIYDATISINEGQEIKTLQFLDDSNYWGGDFPMSLTAIHSNLDTIKSIRILKLNEWEDCVLKDSLFKVSNPLSNVLIIYAQPYNHYFGMRYFVNTQWRFHFNRIYPWRKTKEKFDMKYFLTKKGRHIVKTGMLP